MPFASPSSSRDSASRGRWVRSDAAPIVPDLLRAAAKHFPRLNELITTDAVVRQDLLCLDIVGSVQYREASTAFFPRDQSHIEVFRRFGELAKHHAKSVGQVLHRRHGVIMPAPPTPGRVPG